MIMSRKMNIEYACYSSSKEEKLILHSSFSSTLLEAIYRSIDAEEQSDDTVMYGAESSTRNKKKQSSASDYTSKREEIEKWMEKRTVSTGSQDNPRRKPLEVKVPTARNYGPLSSSTHCLDSSSLQRDYHPTPISKSKSTNSGYQMPNSPTQSNTATSKVQHHSGPGASRGSHFVKTKSHALKFYKELKKMKQPISPGGRLATMINSLFLTGHSKKAKFTNESDHEGPHHTHNQPNNGNSNKSACSSASSFSRSCLSQKTSSSSASSTNKATRSVRFSDEKPVKMDESCDMHNDDIHALLKRYQNEDLFAIYNEFEEEEDEVSSCGSSDLFELDHLLGPVGMEELPVYETTRLESNRPIANSLLA